MPLPTREKKRLSPGLQLMARSLFSQGRGSLFAHKAEARVVLLPTTSTQLDFTPLCTVHVQFSHYLVQDEKCNKHQEEEG